MIRSFRHKGLRDLWLNGRSGKVAADLQKRIRPRLSALDAAEDLDQLNQPGFDFHALNGKPQRYTIHVNGPWCITFEWDGRDAWRVDLEQYH
jgi:proteic killer suppression protein